MCAGYKQFFHDVGPAMKTMAGLFQRGRFADEIMPMYAALEAKDDAKSDAKNGMGKAKWAATIRVPVGAARSSNIVTTTLKRKTKPQCLKPGWGGTAVAQTREWMELASQGIEVLPVAILVCFVLIGTAGWLLHSAIETAYTRYRIVLGKPLQIGLELLVAADIIPTVAVDLTMLNIALLGSLVVVRTVIGWTLSVELEGHWPWQGERKGCGVHQSTEELNSRRTRFARSSSREKRERRND